MKWLINLFTGGLMNRLLKGWELWLDKRNQRLETEAAMMETAVAAEIEGRRIAKEIVVSEQGWWVTSMIRPLFAYPLVIYWSAIIADSMFHFEWDVLALPSPMDEWSGWIIAAYFAGRPIEKAARSFANRRK